MKQRTHTQGQFTISEESTQTECKKEALFVPIWEKYALTIYEAAEYFGIGEQRLRALVKQNKNADYLLWIGVKVEIKRRLFEEFLNSTSSL